MNKTTDNVINLTDRAAVNTVTLARLLDCGRNTAIQIGTAAKARVQLNKRVLWNVRKVQRYLDIIAEDGGADDE